MHELHLPRLGQTMERGTIREWLIKTGQSYEIGEPLYQMESEKVVVQVEAKRPGTMARIILQAGVEVPVGTLLAIVADPGEVLSTKDIEEALSHVQDLPPADLKAPAVAKQAGPAATPSSIPKGIKALPKARALAGKLGIDLATITGSGPQGAITEKDVEAAAESSAAKSSATEPRIRERRPVVGIARAMADTVMRSWREIPQFVQMIWVDAQILMDKRAAEADGIKESFGFELSLNDLIMHATIQAIEEVPDVNATFTGEEIIFYEDINVSTAIATDAGLVVPVLHGVQGLSLGEVGVRIRSLAASARAGNLKPSDVQGGTITVSNLGMFGVETGTPIITPPQAAIVFLGTIKERPIVSNGEIKIGKQLGIAIAYDHRVLGGKSAASFTMALKKRLETPPKDRKPSSAISESPATVQKASSLARTISEKENIPMGGISGTGVGGRIMKADVLAAADRLTTSIPFHEAIKTVAEVIHKYPGLCAAIRGDEIRVWSGEKDKGK